MASYLLSPISPAQNYDFPDTNSKWKERNDRQLRLWGIHGQTRIDEANVCLLNASAVGTEVLKNIVLPGFGQFTVVDNRKVTERDLGLNFFVTRDSLGESLARVVTENLVELNSENVQGNFLQESPATVIDRSPDFFDSYNYVIASQMDTELLRKLAKICWEKNKVLLVIRSYGLIGYVRVVVPCHEVTEAKLDNELDDLRLSAPFEDLVRYCDSQQLDQMDDSTFSHTPYPVLIIKAIQQWRQSVGAAEDLSRLPETRAEKNAFEGILRGFGRTPDDTNVREALDKAFYAWQKPTVTDNVRLIFDHQRCSDEGLKQLKGQEAEFWYLARAIRMFVENEGKGMLPVQGKVPDMHSDTERYVQLQSLFRKKARADMAIVKRHLHTLLRQFGRDENSISDLDIKEFCKNFMNMQVIDYRSIEQELNPATAQRDAMQEQLYDPTSNLPWYLTIRAADAFYNAKGYYPGEAQQSSSGMEDEGAVHDESQLSDDQAARDSEELYGFLTKMLEEIGISDYGMFSDEAAAAASTQNSQDGVSAPSDDMKVFSLRQFCQEITRYGNCELHNISALMGGVGAQELIKLCTKQRKPVNNFWLFNGANATGLTFEA